MCWSCDLLKGIEKLLGDVVHAQRILKRQVKEVIRLDVGAEAVLILGTARLVRACAILGDASVPLELVNVLLAAAAGLAVAPVPDSQLSLAADKLIEAPFLLGASRTFEIGRPLEPAALRYRWHVLVLAHYVGVGPYDVAIHMVGHRDVEVAVELVGDVAVRRALERDEHVALLGSALRGQIFVVQLVVDPVEDDRVVALDVLQEAAAGRVAVPVPGTVRRKVAFAHVKVLLAEEGVPVEDGALLAANRSREGILG